MVANAAGNPTAFAKTSVTNDFHTPYHPYSMIILLAPAAFGGTADLHRFGTAAMLLGKNDLELVFLFCSSNRAYVGVPDEVVLVGQYRPY